MLAFMNEHTLSDVAIIDSKNLILTGTIKNISEQGKAQTKPVQLGSMILSYSHKIMLEYIKFLSPTLESMPFGYTDTDSLHISGKNCNKLIENGYYIENKKNAKLGYLTNDLKNNGLVFHEVAVSPKCYMYSYINDKNEIIHSCKTKGIPEYSKLTIDES